MNTEKIAMYKCLLISCLLMAALNAQCQTDTLRLEDAIAITLKQNHNLQSAKLMNEIQQNLATPGNAGLYPRLSANAGTTYSNQNTTILFNNNIPKNEVKGAVSKGYNANVGLSYTLFDGLGVVYNYRKLQTQAERSDMQNLLTIENTVIQVINAYLETVRLQNASHVALQTLMVSKDRLARVEKGNELGARTGLDLLNARVDFLNDSISMANADFVLQQQKRNLNWLMARSMEIDFYVSLPVIADFSDFNELLNNSIANNRNFIINSLNKEIADLDYAIAGSKRYPVITGNLSYGLNHNKNGAGIVLSSDAVGLSGGLNLSFNLFDGGKVNTQIENAGYALQSSEELKKESVNTVTRDVYNAWNGWLFSSRQQLDEERHVKLAQLNLQRSREAFGTGQITALELRQAQLNELAALNRRLNTTIASLKYYYELKRLSGELVKP